MSKLDCKGTYFKPLRGVEQMTCKALLKVKNGDMSFGELAKSCEYAKNVKKVQAGFINRLNVDNWDEATNLYPKYTTKESLEPFSQIKFQTKSSSLFYCFVQAGKSIFPSTNSH